MRVGDRGLIALPVTGRTGHCSRALRPYTQAPSRIDASDRSAARAHGVDVEHRHAHGKVVDPRLRRKSGFARRKSHVGGRSAHVERERLSKSA